MTDTISDIVCSVCTARVPYSGRGRPPRKCDTCRGSGPPPYLDEFGVKIRRVWTDENTYPEPASVGYQWTITRYDEFVATSPTYSTLSDAMRSLSEFRIACRHLREPEVTDSTEEPVSGHPFRPLYSETIDDESTPEPLVLTPHGIRDRMHEIVEDDGSSFRMMDPAVAAILVSRLGATLGDVIELSRPGYESWVNSMLSHLSEIDGDRR